MARFAINLPEPLLEKLENYYSHEYKYDLRTQVINYMYSEYCKIKDYDVPEQEELPHPKITRSWKRRKKNWLLTIMYPDSSRSFVEHDSFDKLIEVMNEWSKYSYDKSKKETVLAKCGVGLPKNICVRGDKFKVYCTHESGVNSFGIYGTLDDALCVCNFLESNSWDGKYTFSRLKRKKVLTNSSDYPHYMLNLAKQHE